MKKENAMSIMWLQRGAEVGDQPHAVALVAQMYLSGDSVEKDEARSFEYLKKTADQGYAADQAGVGDFRRREAEMWCKKSRLVLSGWKKLQSKVIRARSMLSAITTTEQRSTRRACRTWRNPLRKTSLPLNSGLGYTTLTELA
jgi:hypothetical protein